MRKIKVITIAAFIALSSSAVASSPTTIERAMELYRDGRWIDARLCLLDAKENLVSGNSNDLEDVDFYLAMCAIELDDPHSAMVLDNFERQYPTSAYLNSIHFSKAMLCCEDEDYAAAKDIFAKVKYSSLSRAQQEKYNIRMGYISFLEDDYSEARGYFDVIDKDSDVHHHALYYSSYMDYIQGDNASARDGFTSLLKSDAYGAVAPFYLLQIDFNDGNYEEVLDDGQALYGIATPARQCELSRSMAEAAFRLERYSDAIKYMGLYGDLGGSMGREECYILGFSLYRQVRYREAEQYLRMACGADDSLTQNASYHLADCYLRSGDKISASKSFAMAANEKYSAEIAEDALFNYSKLQFELGNDRFNETVNILTRYINKYPASGERYDQAKELLVATYYNSRNYDAAYRSIMELDNPDSDIRLALQRIALYRGLESYNRGDYADATSQIRESLDVDISPKYSSIARFYLGEIEFAEGNHKSALDNYNAYIVSAPKSDANYPLALYNIAYAKSALGGKAEAIGYFERFIDASAEDTYYRADAYNRAGDIYYAQRQFDHARESYKHASWSKFEPRYYAMYQSAIIDGITGNYAGKIKRLRSIVNSGKGEYVETSMYELGRSYIGASDYKSGVASHVKFVERYPSSAKYAQALSDLGLAYLNLGDKESSVKYYDRAIKSSPQSAIAKDALQGIREIYINNGDANGYFKYAASVGHSGDLNSMTRDSLTFASAQKLYLSSNGESRAAVNSLTDYVKSYPQGYYTTDALYYLSDSYVKQGKNDDAIATLVQLSKGGANHYSERVFDRLSALTYAKKRYAQSAEAYKKLYEISGKLDVRKRALSGYVDATIMEQNDRAIVKMAEYIAKQSSVDSKLEVKAKHAKAKSMRNLGDKNGALAIFKELSADPQGAEGAESAYLVIKAAFDGGNIDSAEQLIFDFAKSETPHLDFLARSFILLGDIYVLRGDNFQARATYQSIIDGYDSDDNDIIKQVRAKIDNLD